MTVHSMEQAFGSIQAAIQGSGLSYAEICRRSGVAIPTFRQWLNGNSQGARLDSVIRVLEACGWIIEIRRAEK